MANPEFSQFVLKMSSGSSSRTTILHPHILDSEVRQKTHFQEDKEVAYVGFVNAAEESSAIFSREKFSENLASMTHQSYRSSLGVDMIGLNHETPNSLSDQIQRHHYAILCFSSMYFLEKSKKGDSHFRNSTASEPNKKIRNPQDKYSCVDWCKD
ncbi:uroporphyrinogen decarboxylase [Striga asiatica]|uniref:Uroporphyrinogen decarboxylase n=1 Tax=Striga asiatica TaxID=4170 RepID=A0A5A7PBS2_STRAF|nr:uroporphyrinogen decarboxylase [Striga asiatica]